MPTNYSGNAANVTAPLVRTVTGCAVGAAGAVRVTTSTSHLYGTHDFVNIFGVVGCTEANGNWTINVIDATHFDLVGSTFANAYVSGGTATDFSCTPFFQVPSDGDAATVGSILSAIEAIADRTQFLAQQNPDHIVDAGNADATITLPYAKNVYRITSTVTADRAYTLSNSSQIIGNIVTFFCEPSFTHAATIKDAGGDNLFVVGNTGGSGGTWASFIYVGGWKLYQSPFGPKVNTQEFTTTGVFLVPDGVYFVDVEGCGGGGGGAAGGAGTTVIGDQVCGGGGGGAGVYGKFTVAVTPGASLNVVIGTGGAGGASANAVGANGIGSYFEQDVSFPTYFDPGAGGFGNTNTGSRDYNGLDVAMGGTTTNWVASSYIGAVIPSCQGGGGCGVPGINANQSIAGGSQNGQTGGNYALSGAHSIPYWGGGAGGGGGAGPMYTTVFPGVIGVGRNGGNGGKGGDGNNSGTGGNGHAGGDAPPNTGGGGGGGGSGGTGSGAGGTFAAGGAGADGKIIISWIK